MSQKAGHLNQVQDDDRGTLEPAEPAPLPINPDLVWDYELPAQGEQSDAFRRWYIARVLTRGRAEDIRAIGLRTIYAYLPQLTLPERIRRFWHWYLSFPDVRERHGIADPSPA